MLLEAAAQQDPRGISVLGVQGSVLMNLENLNLIADRWNEVRVLCFTQATS